MLSQGSLEFARKKIGNKKPLVHISEFSQGPWKDDPYVGQKMALDQEKA
jgi:hypothetical protein